MPGHYTYPAEKFKLNYICYSNGSNAFNGEIIKRIGAVAVARVYFTEHEQRGRFLRQHRGQRE